MGASDMDRWAAVALGLAVAVLLAGCAGVEVATPSAGETATLADGPATPPADGARFDASVTRVVDGDTIEVALANGTAWTIRLVGVDTPEVHVETQPDEYEGVPETDEGRACLRDAGEAASRSVAARLADADVTLVLDPALPTRGGYDRVLAYVVHDGALVNADLVATGRARVYDSDFGLRGRFDAAERAARDDDRGLWQCARSPTTYATAVDATTETVPTTAG
jgi:micrococcal nuclease